MLVRYFLMHSDIKKLTCGGWRQQGDEKMAPFVNSLDESGLSIPMPDPTDSTGTTMTLGKDIQGRKADMFFAKSLEILKNIMRRHSAINSYFYLSMESHSAVRLLQWFYWDKSILILREKQFYRRLMEEGKLMLLLSHCL